MSIQIRIDLKPTGGDSGTDDFRPWSFYEGKIENQLKKIMVTWDLEIDNVEMGEF